LGITARIVPCSKGMKDGHAGPAFNPGECKESDNMEALTRNEKFSIVTNLESKGIE
jgi:hypothetical protein